LEIFDQTYVPITPSYLRTTTNFYSINCNFDKVMLGLY